MLFKATEEPHVCAVLCTGQLLLRGRGGPFSVRGLGSWRGDEATPVLRDLQTPALRAASSPASRLLRLSGGSGLDRERAVIDTPFEAAEVQTRKIGGRRLRHSINLNGL